jgi:hypothetical protein
MIIKHGGLNSCLFPIQNNFPSKLCNPYNCKSIVTWFNNKYTMATFNITSFLLYICHKNISPLSIINLMKRTVSNVRFVSTPPKMQVIMCSYGKYGKKSNNNSESNLHLIKFFRYINLWRHKGSYNTTNPSLSVTSRKERIFILDAYLWMV